MLSAPAMPAATVAMSMSRFLMCASSCAMTPSSSSCGMVLRMPVVTATTALLGLRPVAKALGCSCGATATTGMGSPARWRSRSTIRYSSGACASVTTWARYIRSTSRSEKKYMTKLNRLPMTRAKTRPCEPPSSCPARPNRATRAPISTNVFTLFIRSSGCAPCRGGQGEKRARPRPLPRHARWTKVSLWIAGRRRPASPPNRARAWRTVLTIRGSATRRISYSPSWA